MRLVASPDQGGNTQSASFPLAGSPHRPSLRQAAKETLGRQVHLLWGQGRLPSLGGLVPDRDPANEKSAPDTTSTKPAKKHAFLLARKNSDRTCEKRIPDARANPLFLTPASQISSPNHQHLATPRSLYLFLPPSTSPTYSSFLHHSHPLNNPHLSPSQPTSSTSIHQPHSHFHQATLAMARTKQSKLHFLTSAHANNSACSLSSQQSC